jgi:hypothetical protein
MESAHISILVLILIGLALIALQTYLIQVIWNKVIIKKFPESNIQTLTFWDALAISVFFSLIGISRNIQIGNKQ